MSAKSLQTALVVCGSAKRLLWSGKILFQLGMKLDVILYKKPRLLKAAVLNFFYSIVSLRTLQNDMSPWSAKHDRVH